RSPGSRRAARESPAPPATPCDREWEDRSRSARTTPYIIKGRWWSPVRRVILTAACDELRFHRGRTGVRRRGPPIHPREPTGHVRRRWHGRGLRLGRQLASLHEGPRRAGLAQHVLAESLRRPRAADVHEARPHGRAVARRRPVRTAR